MKYVYHIDDREILFTYLLLMRAYLVHTVDGITYYSRDSVTIEGAITKDGFFYITPTIH